MSPPRFPAQPERPHKAAVTAGVSWMALVAAATLGIRSVEHLRAAVRTDTAELAKDGAGGYRLIVQSYARDNVVDGVPQRHARPLGSAQREVTAAELARGVDVDVVGLGESADGSRVVVAWVERGSADLDFDARRARPGRDAFVGVASAEVGVNASVVLQRRA